jgi:multidrug efflux pump subunit AcrA (membrane-fusion protein)
VETGDRVAAGDALAALDVRSLRARRQQLAGQLAEIELHHLRQAQEERTDHVGAEGVEALLR